MLTKNKYCVSFLYYVNVYTTPPIEIDMIDSQLDMFPSYKPIAEYINILENSERYEDYKVVIKPNIPDLSCFCISVSQIDSCFDFADYLKGLYQNYLKNCALDFDDPVVINLISMPKTLDLASLMQILLSELHSRTEKFDCDF